MFGFGKKKYIERFASFADKVSMEQSQKYGFSVGQGVELLTRFYNRLDHYFIDDQKKVDRLPTEFGFSSESEATSYAVLTTLTRFMGVCASISGYLQAGDAKTAAWIMKKAQLGYSVESYEEFKICLVILASYFVSRQEHLREDDIAQAFFLFGECYFNEEYKVGSLIGTSL